MNDWEEEDDMDSSQFLPKESDTLLPSFQRKKRTKKVVFEDEDEYSSIDKLYNLINKKEGA